LSTHSLIFDIGCHDGRDSKFYLKKGFTVVAVEANPSLCRQLKQRFAGQIASGQFLLVEKAIAEQGGDVEFYLNLKASIGAPSGRNTLGRIGRLPRLSFHPLPFQN
jgi:FkbM family methyltransferase